MIPQWVPLLIIALAAGGFIYWKKRKDDDDDDNHVSVPSNPTQEESMKKFAVIVGINEYAMAGMDLSGCVNDANNMKKFLIECCGFKEAGIKMLTNSKATKRNILAHLDWLVSGRKAGDELFYYHSGHGTQVFDDSGDEADQLDEVLVAHDFDWTDPLLDDEVAAVFKQLPQGAFLSMICDTCHSGSMSRSIDKNIPMPKEMAEKMNGRSLKRRKFGMKKDGSNQRHILLSGCKDNQTSSETLIDGMRQGLLTYNFIKECRASARSWADIHAAIVKTLNMSGWTQIPVLSGTDDLKNRTVFGL